MENQRVSVHELSPASNGALMLNGIDHIHLFVGNALHAMHFFCKVFGFTAVAYSGPDTGTRDRVAYVVKQNNIQIVLTSSLDTGSRVAEMVGSHGDAVADIAFLVSNAGQAFQFAVSHGAMPVVDPVKTEDESGEITTAAVRAFGDVVHTFVQRNEYNGCFMPGYRALPFRNDAPCYLSGLDHIAVGLPVGHLDKVSDFYTETLGLKLTHSEHVITEYSGMKSKVVQNATGTVRIPMMEPRVGPRSSQIEEYLKYNRGAGVQHLAFTSNDLIQAVRGFRQAGAEFLSTPAAYYDMLTARIGAIMQGIADLTELSILADRDEWGYLLQIFSKPIVSRPTLFVELIQREGARGFGSGNIRALFEAVEREQAIRGNL